MLILASAAGETRASRGRPVLAGIQVAVVGVASLWSFEALLYTLGAIAGLAAFRVATASGGRLKIVIRLALQLLAAVVIVQLAFALATLAASGKLPDWGKYVATLREFLSGGVGDWTYDFSPWSAGLAVGAIYLASALAMVMVLWREPDLTRANRGALLVLSGTTGYGIALFSYLVNRSAEHIVPYISLPAVMVVVLWLSILLRDGRLSRIGRGLAVGSAAAAATLLVAVAWSNAGLRFSQSALAYAPPGGKSFRGAIDELTHGPAISRRCGRRHAHARHLHARRARVGGAHLGRPLRGGADANAQDQPDPAQRSLGGQPRSGPAHGGGRSSRRSASSGEAHADRSGLAHGA